MSLHLAAQHLQSQGRGDDTHLVHMTTGELHALNELAKKHGHPLTINPHTGLPEAGFLSAVLPTIAGIGLGALTGDPLLAAGIVGAADTAITGSLGQGLMAGFGAWGGANFYNNIADFGANPNNAFSAQETLAQATPEVDATTGEAVNTATSQAPVGPDGSYNIAPNYDINPATQIQTGLNPQVVAPATTTASGEIKPGGYTGKDFSQGLKNAFAHPIDYLSKPGNTMNALTTLGPAALAGYKALNQPDTYAPIGTQSNVPDANKLKYNSPNFQAMLPPQLTPYQPVYRNYVTNPYNPYAAKRGGLMDVHKYASAGLADLEDMTKPSKKDVLEAEQKAIADINKGAAMFKRPAKEMPQVESTIYVDKNPNTANLSADQAAAYLASANAITAQMPSSYFAGMTKFPSLGAISTEPVVASKFAHGGEAHGLPDYHLGDYSDGGRLLKGPGDGVSDSIPATIGHKQPARLAEGEFVIPARIVSELGNGSTDAGAKRLYAMMDRIKAKRAKAKDIAADTKAYKLLPA
jgi:hypothetical protein